MDTERIITEAEKLVKIPKIEELCNKYGISGIEKDDIIQTLTDINVDIVKLHIKEEQRT